MEFQILYFTHSIVAITVIVSLMAFRDAQLFENFLFSSRKIVQNKEYHRLLTSTLLHADLGHLLFNMISLYSFAHLMEYKIGWVKMLLFYFASGIAGDALALFLNRYKSDYRAVGASGAVLGIIFGSIFLSPGGSVYIFFIPIPIPDWIYALLFIFISLYGMGNARSFIGHEAHLGGAMAGMCLAALFYPEITFQNLPLFLGILSLIGAFLVISIYKPDLLKRTRP